MRAKALAAVIAGYSIFGFSFLFSKLALQLTVPSVLIAFRFLTAFAVLNLIALVGPHIKINGKPLMTFSLTGKPKKYIILLAIFQPILYFLFESYGIVYTSSAFAGTIIAIVPIGGIIADLVIMHSKISKTQVVCAGLSFLGVLITTIGAQGMKSSFFGLLLLLGCVLSASLYYVFNHKSGQHYNAIEQTYMMFGLGSAVYVVFALLQCRGQYDVYILPVLTNPQFIGPVLYLAVVSSVIAYICLNYGCIRISVSQASLVANLTTVISILAGILILHESFGPAQILGAAVILFSVYLANRK